MRQVLNKSMIVMAAASGILTAAAWLRARRRLGRRGRRELPGVASGNAVQVPVHVPVNVCGNTVNVIALLNPAFGNTCANVSSADHHDDNAYGDEHGGAYGDEQDGAYGGGHGGHSGSGASADGKAVGSPGVLSGNLVQAPVDVPVNACGNSVNVVGLLNPASGNTCVNDSAYEHPPVEPPVEEPPAEVPPTEEPPAEVPRPSSRFYRDARSEHARHPAGPDRCG